MPPLPRSTPRLLPSWSLTPPHWLPATATSHSPSVACSASGLPFPHPNSSCSVLPHNRRCLFVSITSATALPPHLPTDAPSPSLSLPYT
ncbi:Os11g0104601 [Oryza sativa Japonica Group]|uniref:Os11g0104601 protein n=2 Tax=Oryza TaxID=4527 RepID=A0A0N7KSA8_ORYSJ|nr:Os11g0104601 [Oryza sativa Japonica Group]